MEAATAVLDTPEPAKRGLRRVARKTDSTSEKRRKKLAKIREELAQRKAENDSSRPVLANRLTDAIRESSVEKPNAKKRRKPKPARKGVGWVLDAEAVRETLDSRVAPGSGSSDAQAVSTEALQAELELRRMMAISTANFQLDACPNIPVAEAAHPVSSSADAAADVRQVAPLERPAAAETPVVPVRPEPESQPQPTERPVAAVEPQNTSLPVKAVVSEMEVDFGNSAAAAASCGMALVEPEPVPVESYGNWFKRVVVRNRWLTWFTTFYIHWAVLLLLAAIIVHGPDETAELLLSAAFATEEDTPSTPFEMTVPIEEVEAVEEPEAEAEPVEETPAEIEEEQLDISESVLSEMVPQGVATQQASTSSEATDAKPPAAAVGPQHVDRAPALATRQGSFSVWTEPANPRPGDPYRIIIQVRLPEKTEKYLVTDLEGVVVGSDGYRKPIPGFATGELPVVDGYARLSVPIVSADKRVRDTVFIRSRLLRETQKLLIEF